MAFAEKTHYFSLEGGRKGVPENQKVEGRGGKGRLFHSTKTGEKNMRTLQRQGIRSYPYAKCPAARGKWGKKAKPWKGRGKVL